ncbi:MAG: helical backbone metal receptor [Cyclobacteriaceae bacterium]|nr:helical backbone metal receptor [Cyclobacteriaceae bacterium]MCX7637976.1 helical backbone metal receptor [Cyclobacteriaceae bacterium]
MTEVTATDHLGYRITFRYPPQRIVSLVPSQTELLFELGLGEKVVGITKFCVHPPAWRRAKTIIGGTKNFRFDVIRKLQPDLIIGNKEENYRQGIDELKQEFPVWMSDVITLADAFRLITDIGEITGTTTLACTLREKTEQAFAKLEQLPPLRTLYLIWKEPWMGAASETFINEMLTAAGLINVLQHQKRYPELTGDELIRLQPEVVMLSSEPYPFREKHVNELQQLLPQARIVLVDGEMFSWYGSRMLYFPQYVKLLNDRLR